MKVKIFVLIAYEQNFPLMLSLITRGDFSHLLIVFANSFDPDQNVGSDLDPNCLTL